MKTLDTDGDGKVSLEEFNVWWIAHKNHLIKYLFCTNILIV